MTKSIKRVAPKKAVKGKLLTKKSEIKKAAVKTNHKIKSLVREASGKNINNVKVRMYCLGTGDCFVLKFCHNNSVEFTMLIDCGSCQGTPADFQPYIDHLIQYVNNHIDLLIVTHEHQDHVNGFAKCENVFNKLNIDEAWFAWTEDPDDPTGAAKKLQEKRSKMKKALSNALNKMTTITEALAIKMDSDYYIKTTYTSNRIFLDGLETMAEINLPAAGEDAGNSLAGMLKIKEILKKSKKTKVKYLNPGDTVSFAKAKGVKFHILGPPMDREFIFKDGKEGVDVFKKRLSLSDSSLAANSLVNINEPLVSDLPFPLRYTIQDESIKNNSIVNEYNDAKLSWRKIDEDWLTSAGSLALRLNSHINNTSLAMAIEFESSKKVLLFPGDAEYGSWESWYDIEKWKPKAVNDKHFVEDLLNRTIFYKVGHHLSYNGTALEKGIMKMNSDEFVAMATLDRNRISKGWKSTMPNKFLMQEIIKRSRGKFFIMDEFEINNGPSKTLDPKSINITEYESELIPEKNKPYYKQYTCKVD